MDENGAAPPPLLVVDGANVVGSVPDGWWRDRRGAAERLRDALVPLADRGLAEHPGPLEVVLVVEGAARGVDGVPGVRVVAASGSGDDRIVELVRAATARHPARVCVVATADRELRSRVGALGAAVTGPRSVRPSTQG
ncbi:NTP pyrophosphohydrolase [Kitasatospora sp. NPDC018619]|uniref:NTP pyrophosphohydrolase n=1 Tax=unclassified Kitasatospora TaxID=2633591 RepID=UPI0037B2CD5A